MHNKDLIKDELLIMKCANAVKVMNTAISTIIGINQALRCTTIKPSGNSSTIAGCSAGIHPYHAKHYIRRMRINKINPIWQEIKNKLPEVCCDDDPQVGIVAFACEAPDNAILRKDLKAIEFLDWVASFQRHWVLMGDRIDENQKGLTHNVSNTCTVKFDEWDEVKEKIWSIRNLVKGVSLLSDYGDMIYKNAPYETSDINDEKYQVLLNADWSKVDLLVGGYIEPVQVDPACAGGVCLL
jgi:ribonucleoside-diphosphate reductase alpha chain